MQQTINCSHDEEKLKMEHFKHIYSLLNEPEICIHTMVSNPQWLDSFSMLTQHQASYD